MPPRQRAGGQPGARRISTETPGLSVPTRRARQPGRKRSPSPPSLTKALKWRNGRINNELRALALLTRCPGVHVFLGHFRRTATSLAPYDITTTTTTEEEEEKKTAQQMSAPLASSGDASGSGFFFFLCGASLVFPPKHRRRRVESVCSRRAVVVTLSAPRRQGIRRAAWRTGWFPSAFFHKGQGDC